MKRKKILLIIAAITLILLLISNHLLNQQIQAQVLTIAPSTIDDIITEKALINTGTPYAVIAPTSGELLKLHMSKNDNVQPGDILAEIDTQALIYQKNLHQNTLALYQAQLEQAQISQLTTTTPAEYLSALQENLTLCQNSYDLAKTTAENTTRLYEAGAVSKTDYDTAQNQLISAATALSQASQRYQASQQILASLQNNGLPTQELNSRFQQSNLDQLKGQIASEQATISELNRQIADCTVTAKVSGYITELPAENASMIQAGQTIAVINSYETTTASADVLISIEPYLKINDPVLLTQSLRGTQCTYTGHIQDIDRFAQTGTSALGLTEQRVTVTIAIEDSQQQLKDGYQLNADFTLYHGDNQLTVPNSALFKMDDQYYVFLYKNGHAQKTAVTVSYQSNTTAVLTAGVAEGDRIIRNAATDGLYDGCSVKVIH